MSAVSKQLRREMIEHEIHGIDVELETKIMAHKVLTTEIEQLEEDKEELRRLLEEVK